MSESRDIQLVFIEKIIADKISEADVDTNTHTEKCPFKNW